MLKSLQPECIPSQMDQQIFNRSRYSQYLTATSPKHLNHVHTLEKAVSKIIILNNDLNRSWYPNNNHSRDLNKYNWRGSIHKIV